MNRSLFASTSGTQSTDSALPIASSVPNAPVKRRKPPVAISTLVRTLGAVLLAASTLLLSSCSTKYYKFPATSFAGRAIPPSKLAQRVMIAYTAGGTSGALAIVDALRDIRSNIENTIPGFGISGYSSGYPANIFNFPAETRGYVYSTTDGSLAVINYSTEAGGGSAGTYQAGPGAIAIPSNFGHIYGAEEAAGILIVADNLSGRTFTLNLPNVFRVAVNVGDSVALAMVRNSNQIYRVVKLNAGSTNPPGAIDCQPVILPVYCVVPVPGTFDEPSAVYFSLDGTTAYVLNCGPECGGTTASVTSLQQGPLNLNVVPTALPYPSAQIANVPVPGGVTVALSDSNTLYMAGQQLMPDGLLAGYLSTMNLATNTITGKYSISDGSHSKMLFADNNTLWIGSQFCATGEHAKLKQNYNCLTMVPLGGTTLSPQILPNVTPGSPTAVVPFPNGNNDQYYYGSLTGLCWVQNFNKVYTAYGGGVHVFSTVDGSEINNQFVTVQGTALDVAYMDALSDGAN